ncbi:MAG: hypothetical protein H7096_03870 [Flavobacterium sp.]|nr:hypothetical protein [Pedobacter sp.]
MEIKISRLINNEPLTALDEEKRLYRFSSDSFPKLNFKTYNLQNIPWQTLNLSL